MIIKEIEQKIDDMNKHYGSAIHGLNHMKANFDQLTVHKRYFDALVQKPITYADKIKASLIEQINQINAKGE